MFISPTGKCKLITVHLKGTVRLQKDQHLEKPKVKDSDCVRTLWCGYWTYLGPTLLFKRLVNVSVLVNQGSEGVHSSASKRQP